MRIALSGDELYGVDNVVLRQGSVESQYRWRHWDYWRCRLIAV
jgi:hypothetical protein